MKNFCCKKMKSILTNAKISREFAKEEKERERKYLQNLSFEESVGITEEIIDFGSEILEANRKWKKK